MSRTIFCVKLQQEAEGLDFPPYPGELGKRIWENVSKEALPLKVLMSTQPMMITPATKAANNLPCAVPRAGTASHNPSKSY